MSVFMSDGSYRQRAKCSEAATEAARESRRLKVALQTFETLKQFEDTLQAQAARSFYDEIPMEALPTRWTHHGSFQAMSMGRSIASEPNLHPTPVLTHDNGTEKDPRRLRPPSPLHFHDYGCISLKSRSKHLQHRLKLGKPVKKVPTGHAFFVPGSHFKPGTYGDKLLDPCLMAPMCWAPAVQGCATRYSPDVLDFRPLSTPILAAELSRQKPLGEPPSKVRGNVASRQRARAHGEAMLKRCREDLTEQRRYENGIFLGTWRDPLLDSGGIPELTTADFGWLPGALEDLLAGKSEEELGLKPPQLNAFLLLIHLDHAVRQGKTCLSKIFNAENKGPRNQLEIAQFYRGLKRIHVIEALDLSEEALCEALYELDPGFDGRVYLPVLDRALKVLASTGVYSRKSPSVEEEYGPMAYGETSPVRSIDIPMEADSINNFRKAFKCFRDQQNELLSFHSNLKHLTGDENEPRSTATKVDQ